MEFTAKQIADFLGGEVVGNNNEKVHTFAKIEEGTKGALSFYPTLNISTICTKQSLVSFS